MNDLILLPEPEPRQSKNASRPKETIEIVVEPRERRYTQSRRSPLSALLGLAALLGAGVYVFQFMHGAVPKQAPTPVAATAPDAGLTEAKREIAALQTEVRDLRAKLEAVEKRPPSDAAEAKPPEAASATPAATASAPAPAVRPAKPAPQTALAPQAAPVEPPVTKVAPTPRPLSGYRIREAFRSNALVETRRGIVDVQPGDVLPGAGRVLGIEKRAGRWVVATENGDIVGGAPAQARAPAPRRRPIYREEYGYEPEPPLFVPF